MKSNVKLTAKANGFILEADGQVLSIDYEHFVADYYECSPISEQAINLIYKYKSEVNKFLGKLGKDKFTGSYWIEGEERSGLGNTFSFKNGTIITKYSWKVFKSVWVEQGVCDFIDDEPIGDCLVNSVSTISIKDLKRL